MVVVPANATRVGTLRELASLPTTRTYTRSSTPPWPSIAIARMDFLPNLSNSAPRKGRANTEPTENTPRTKAHIGLASTHGEAHTTVESQAARRSCRRRPCSPNLSSGSRRSRCDLKRAVGDGGGRPDGSSDVTHRAILGSRVAVQVRRQTFVASNVARNTHLISSYVNKSGDIIFQFGCKPRNRAGNGSRPPWMFRHECLPRISGAGTGIPIAIRAGTRQRRSCE